jgi:BASS family bile acid:Na+ symporter
VAIHNACAFLLGNSVARLAHLPQRDRRALTIEVGIQNSGLGLVLIFNFFGGLGGAAVIAAWWGVWHLIAGLTIAGLWAWMGRRAGATAPVAAVE